MISRALLVSSRVSVTPMVGQCGCRTYRWSASSAMSMAGAASGRGSGCGGCLGCCERYGPGFLLVLIIVVWPRRCWVAVSGGG